MIPLSLISLGRSVHHSVVQASCVHAAVIDIITILFIIDERIAFGKSCAINLKEEVIVITGGANGLGLILAQMLGMKGASVAVLDVQEPAESEVKGVTFFKCDIADSKQIEAVERQIRKTLGPATTLINNAGVLKANSIFDMTEAELDASYRVNTLSHFQAIKAFLPNMLSEGHGSIVTISSVLGRLGCSNLSAYTSTKAALLAMHASLRADLQISARTNAAAKNIQTVLVTPGQLNTSMFGDVVTPSNFLAPLVEPVELAREIVKYIEEGRSGEISMPLYTRFIPWLDVLPAGIRELVRRASGMDNAMSVMVEKRKPRSK